MAIKTDERQYPLVAVVDFAFGDFTSGVAVDVADLPSDAIVVGGDITITTPFNSATSDLFTVGDTDLDTRYASGVNGAVAARTALTPTGAKLGAGKKLVLKWTGAGAAPTAGAGRAILHYVRQGRSNENQG